MIVVFSHAHPSISKGGAEVSAYTLFKGLRQLGHAATFVAMCPEQQIGKVQFETDAEIAIPYRPENYDHFFHIGPPALGEDLIETLAPLKPTALVFHHFLFLGTNTIGALVEHFATPSAIVLHEFLAICHHHGQMVTKPQKKLCSQSSPTRCSACFPELAPEELGARRANFMEVLTSVSALVSPSHFLADRFVEWGIPQERLHVIENGLSGYAGPDAGEPVVGPGSSAPAEPAMESTDPRTGPKPTVFGYFGQINPFKGVDLILDALQHIETKSDSTSRQVVVRVHGNIIGVTDQFQKAFDEGVKRGTVEYHGPYVNSDVHHLMQRCDYVLMASKWWENSPVVIQEAYAADRPVIAPALGGMAEKVIDKVSGRHFIPADAQDLARVLLECTRTREEYKIPTPSTAPQMAQAYLEMLDI